jgi:hypothetical protein
LPTRIALSAVLNSQILWPTPALAIDHKNIDELNEGLARIVLEKEREIIAKGSPKSVAGLKEGLTAHWLEYNVLNWKYPEVEEFRRLVLNEIREFFKLIGDPDDPGLKISGISCWANVLRYKQTLEVHHHRSTDRRKALSFSKLRPARSPAEFRREREYP